MHLPGNRFKARLGRGPCQIGMWSSLCHNISAEILGNAGFDWIVLDAEHAPNDERILLGQLQALGLGTAVPIVRVAANEPVLVKRVLDIGALNVLFPQIHTAKEAVAAVRATRFPPLGIRGVATSARSSRFGAVQDYLKRAHQELCVIVMLESAQAIENIRAIASVDGVDALLVGPQDLAADLGHIGEPNHPEVQDAVNAAVLAAKQVPKPLGIMTGNEEDARRWIAAGLDFVGCGNDVAVLGRACERLAASLRSRAHETSCGMA